MGHKNRLSKFGRVEITTGRLFSHTETSNFHETEKTMKILTLMAALFLLAFPLLAGAQEEPESTGVPTRLEELQKLAELIKTSEDAREAGIPEEDVAEVLEDARERGLSADETDAVLAESTEAVKESGTVDNFGVFVQSKLDEGLRGKELADAIHEEHRTHGKGKGHDKHKTKKGKDQGDLPDHEGRHADQDDVGDQEGDHKGHSHEGHNHDKDQGDGDDKDDDDKDDDRGKGNKKEKGNK